MRTQQPRTQLWVVGEQLFSIDLFELLAATPLGEHVNESVLRVGEHLHSRSRAAETGWGPYGEGPAPAQLLRLPRLPPPARALGGSSVFQKVMVLPRRRISRFTPSD